MSIDNQPASYTESYVTAYYVPTPPKLHNPPSWTFCSCVNTAKAILGKEGEKWGNARDLEPTTLVPEKGFLVLTNEGPGHTGVVASVSADLKKIHVVEGNWKPCEKTERELSVDSPVIRGFRPPPEKNDTLQSPTTLVNQPLNTMSSITSDIFTEVSGL